MIEEFAWVTIIARAVERLLIVGVGFAALLYGFKLFRIVSEQTGQLVAEKGNVKIHLSQVGPGVFFALFGAALVIALIYKAPELDGKAISMATATDIHYRGGVPIALPSDSETLRKSLASLNSVYLLATKANLSEADKQVFAQATSGIDILRASLVDALLKQPGRFAEWQSAKALQQVAPKQFEETMQNAEARSRFLEVDKLASLSLNELELEGQQ